MGTFSFLKKIVPDTISEVSFFDRRLFCRKQSDFSIYRVGLANRLAPTSHEISSIINLMGFMSQGVTFVDVGANIGLYSIFFASVGEILGFDVIAIEPDLETVKILKRNLSEYNNCKILQLICSNKEEEYDFLQVKDSSKSVVYNKSNFKYIEEKKLKGRLIKVKGQRLDRILQETEGNLVVKIDVENFEKEVVEGASELITSKRIIALMIDATGDLDIDFIKNCGYELYDGRSLKKDNHPYNNLFVLKN